MSRYGRRLGAKVVQALNVWLAEATAHPDRNVMQPKRRSKRSQQARRRQRQP